MECVEINRVYSFSTASNHVLMALDFLNELFLLEALLDVDFELVSLFLFKFEFDGVLKPNPVVGIQSMLESCPAFSFKTAFWLKSGLTDDDFNCEIGIQTFASTSFTGLLILILYFSFSTAKSIFP